MEEEKETIEDLSIMDIFHIYTQCQDILMAELSPDEWNRIGKEYMEQKDMAGAPSPKKKMKVD